MKKITFFELSPSVDTKTTGTKKNQINDLLFGGDNGVPVYNKYQEFYYDFLPDDFGMDLFIGNANAKRTDLLSSSFLDTSGYFISQKFENFLSDYKICNYKYMPITIKNLSENNEYRFLNLIKCPLLNFEKSDFEVTYRKNPEKNHPITLKSNEEFLIESNNLPDYSVHIAVKKAVIKQEIDLFKYEITGRKLISERLKNAIEKSDLKGIWIEPITVDFFIED